MKINKQKIGVMVVAGVILILPLIAFANEHIGIVPCGVPGGEYLDSNKAPQSAAGECGFSDLIILASNIMTFLIYYVAVPLAALGFMWAGSDLVINQKKEEAWSKAKDRFWDIGKGFAIMIAAFLLIRLILDEFLSVEQKAVTNLIIGS